MSFQELRTGCRLRWRPRWGIAFVLGFLHACAGRGTLPEVPEPPIVERVDQPTDLPPSHLLLPLVSNVAAYEAVLADVLREHLVVYQERWTRVTGPGVVPVVESRMESRIGTPSLHVEGRSVRVDVPFTYWGEVRARAKAGIGPMWMSTGTAWGSESTPGHITLGILVKPEVDDRWRLKTKSKLVKIKLEAPPFEQVCADSILRVCVGRETAVKIVHTLLEREIRKAAPKLIAALDKRVAQQADFRSAVEMGFRALSTPAGPGALWLDIERMALSQLHGKDKTVGLDLELTFRPSWAERPAGAKPALPARTYPSEDASSAVHFDLSMSFADLSATLTEACRDLRHESFHVTGVEALGAVGPGPALALALTLQQEERTHTVYVAATPRATQTGFHLAEPKLSTASKELLDELDVDVEALIRGFESRAQVTLEGRVKTRITDLQNRLALLTLAFGAVALDVTESRYDEIWYESKGVAVRVTSLLAPRALH